MASYRARLGPILYARPSTQATWKFAIGILVQFSGAKKQRPKATPKAPPLEVTVGGKALKSPAQPAGDFWTLNGSCFWVWEVSVPRGKAPSSAAYRLAAKQGHSVSGLPPGATSVAIPATGDLPRIAFFSCNGYSDPDAMRKARESEDPFALWDDVLAQASSPESIHLMIGGGDQIYADSLWHTVAELDAIREKSRKLQAASKPSGGFAEKIREAYLELYVSRWKEPRFAKALASVPGVFTWDDHDIFDGWGSYEQGLQTCPYYAQIFAAADETFRVFQLGGESRPVGVGFSPIRKHHLQALEFQGGGARLDVLLLDLRSERTSERVMSGEQWSDLKAWLDRRVTSKRTGHLLVVSSIPVIYMRFAAWQERVARVADLDDDMRDQWESKSHQGERQRLMMTLLEHGKRSMSRVTVLSGDIHVGSRGRLLSSRDAHILRDEDAEASIEQLTSSAIVHPAPSGIQFALMQAIGGERDEDIAPGVTTRLLPVGNDSYLRGQNWMAISFDSRSAAAAGGNGEMRLWAQWRASSGPIEPFVVVSCPA